MTAHVADRPLDVPAPDAEQPARSHARAVPVIDAVALPVVEVQGNLHVVSFVNAAFCTLVGKTSPQLVGKTFAQIAGGDADCVAPLDHVYKTAEEDAHGMRVVDGVDTDGSLFLYAVWPTLDAAETRAGVVIQLTTSTSFRRDVTDANEALLISALRQHELTEAAQKLNGQLQEEVSERCRVEEALRQAMRGLELADRRRNALVEETHKLQRQMELADRLSSLGTLAAGVAHEINNPLAAVLSNAQFLSASMTSLRESLTTQTSGALQLQLDEFAEALVDIETSARRVKQIVADLKQFSRPQQHTQTAIDVVACVQWALRTTVHEFAQRARLITVLHPVATVLADETKLGQVLINVLVNAAQAIAPDHFDDNTVTVTTSTDTAGRVVIEVKDTGAGMTEAVRTRIFEPFFTTKGTGVGTGLGLSISHGIVAAMGGSIELDSTIGVGTTVRILLPASNGVVTAAKKEHAREQLVHRARILVIDDEPSLLRIIARVLRDHDVVCVERAGAALDLLNAGERFDLILSDITMPSMSGIEFYERLVTSRPADAERVVFLSGGAITSRSVAFLESVPNARLEKPFDIHSLLDVVHQQLAAQRHRSAAARLD